MPVEAFFWFTARTVIRCSDRWWKRLNLGTGIVAEKFKFSVGQLIEHQRYGYRGVVVSRDEQCRASKGWYESNLTRPARDQPWYHVMVDGASHTTYVAESNLKPDSSDKPVRHPLIKRFFNGFHNGHYYKACQY